jgi:hypothetical protein
VPTLGTGTLGSGTLGLPLAVIDPVEPPALSEPRQTWGERLYEGMTPIAYADAEHGDALRHFLGALGVAHQPLEEVIADTENGPGWAIVFDVDTCPAWGLPWLAQLVGVQLPVGITEAEARDRIRVPVGFARGMVAATVAAAQRKLTGTRKVTVIERVEGNAYQYTVVTRSSETPDPAGTERDIRAEKPVGLLLTYVVSTGPIVDELEGSINDQTGTVGDYLTA